MRSGRKLLQYRLITICLADRRDVTYLQISRIPAVEIRMTSMKLWVSDRYMISMCVRFKGAKCEVPEEKRLHLS